MAEHLEQTGSDELVPRRQVLKGMLGVAALIATGPVIENVIGDGIIDDYAESNHILLSGENGGWIRLVQPDADKIPWQTFKGNRGLGNWLRLTDQTYDAGVLRVPRESFDAQTAQLPKSAQPAAIWYPGGEQIELAQLPWDIMRTPALPDDYAIAMGVKKDDLKATLGAYVPETRSVIIAEGVQSGGEMHTFDLAARFPGVSWILRR